MLTSSKILQLEYIDGNTVAVITLNDPEHANAMSPEMGDAFSEAIRDIQDNDAARVTIIRGAGQHFSIGGHRDMLIELGRGHRGEAELHAFMLAFYKEPRAIRRKADMKLTVLLLAGTAVLAQTPKLPVTDAEKIADALRAGPTFITRTATILDWPGTPDGDYRVLRKGSSEWSCLPAVPGYPHDEPGCFDRVFLQWMKDSLAGRTTQIESVGIAYMYIGAWVPDASGHAHTADHAFHVGPHIMIVSPHNNQGELQKLNRDGSNGIVRSQIGIGT
jgi:hypothetical protein